MSCPKCGRHVDDDAVICPGCDFIIDSSFLGDDITDAKEPPLSAREPSLVVENPLLSSAGYGQDDLILGDGAGEFEAFESQNTGLAREVTHARIFVGGAASELLRPDAIPGLKEGVDPSALKLTPFEVHVLSLVNAYRPVGRIRKKSGMSDAEVHTSLAMLHDKGVIELSGHVSEDRKDRARKRRKDRRRAERAARKGATANTSSPSAKKAAPRPPSPRVVDPDVADASNVADRNFAESNVTGGDGESGLADSALERAADNIDAQLSREPSGRSDAALARAIGNPARDDIPSAVERTMISLPPNAPEPDVAADARGPSEHEEDPSPREPARQDPFVPAPTGDVDLDALAADAAADVRRSDAADIAEGPADAPQMSEQELLLSMAEGAVSEVALESESHGGDFDLDALAEGAARQEPPPPAASPASEDDGPLFSDDGDFDLDGPSAADTPMLPTVDPALDGDDEHEVATHARSQNDPSGPLPPEERVLEALVDEFDAFDRNDLEPTGALDTGVSIDVGSIDMGSIDVGSIDIASVDIASAEDEIDGGPSMGPPPLPSSESIPMGFSLEEDQDLADALLDSEEGEAFDDSNDASVIRPAAKVAPAMTSARSGASTTRAPTASEVSPLSTAALNAPRPGGAPPLPGQGLPPSLPGSSSSPPAGVPPLPGSGAPPLPGALDSAEGAEGISLEGFSLEDSSEEQRPTSRLPPSRAPSATGQPLPQPMAPPPTAAPAPPVQAVSFEMKRKARLIFEQGQKDMAEGRPSSALMNAKLACIYDPTEPEFSQALEGWQNLSMSNMARPKELLLFEEAKDAELAGDYEDAVALLRQALDINPRAAPIYNRLGVILATRLKQFAPASQALLQACELDPGNLAYKNNLGKILVMEEKEVDGKRKKKGLADRLLGGKEDANIRVRTIRPKQF